MLTAGGGCTELGGNEAPDNGMKARGFRGTRPNPYRERAIVNLHHNLAKYMGTGAPRELK